MLLFFSFFFFSNFFASQLKLDEFRLSEESVDLSGEYTTKGAQSSYLRIASESFSKVVFFFGFELFCVFIFLAQSSLDGNCHGSLLNVNTIESFKTLDRKAIVSKTVERFLNDVASGAAERDPRLLTRFSLITFADLKQYKVLEKRTSGQLLLKNVFLLVSVLVLFPGCVCPKSILEGAFSAVVFSFLC